MYKIIIVLLLLTSAVSNAQKVDLKKNKVIINNKEAFDYEKMNNLQYSFYNNDGEEILMYKYQNNQTQNYEGDDYFTVHFLTLKKKVNTSDFALIYAINSRKNMAKLIKLLLKERVIDLNGEINPERVDVFYEKYNQIIK